MATELAQAYVQIVPSAAGISGGIADAIVPDAQAAGNEAGDGAGLQFGVAFKAAVAAAGIAMAIKGAFDGLNEFAAAGDAIDKTSQKIGISTKAYQEWDAVLKHSGTDISVMKTAMRTLSNAAVDGSDAFEKLGISQEEAASMSQEDLFARVIEGLQNMEAGSERAALAQDLLGRSSQEMAVLLNTSAEDTQAMKDRVNELGGVLSEDAVKNSAAFKDALQDLGTSFSGLTNGAMAEFLPCVTEIMEGLTNLFSGDGEGGIAMIVSGLGSLGETIMTVVPQLMETGATIITAICEGIVQYLPTMIDTGFTMLGEFATGFLNNLPTMIDNVSTVLNGAIQWIMQNYPTFLQKGVEVLGKVAQGVIQNLPAIVGAVARMVASFLATVTQNLPSFLAKGIEILGKVVAGIIQSIPSIVTAAGDAVKQAASAFTSYDWGKLGSDIIDGVKQGVKNAAGRLAQAAKDAVKGALDSAKDFLNINSPSRVFRDQVGRPISEGIAAGIEIEDSPQKAVVGKLKGTLKSAQNVNIDGISAGHNTSASADRILAILERYLPECAETDVYLGDKLVSEVNRSLGMKARFA